MGGQVKFDEVRRIGFSNEPESKRESTCNEKIFFSFVYLIDVGPSNVANLVPSKIHINWVHMRVRKVCGIYIDSI